MKKLLAFSLAVLLVAFTFAACNDDMRKELVETSDNTEAPAAATELTVLLSTPAQAESWNEIARAYEEKTGVRVRVTTVSGESYAEALQKGLQSDGAPVIFEVNRTTDTDTLKNSMTDLKGTSFASFLSDATLSVRDADKVLAVPMDVTAYGILYNEALTDRYFALENKGTSYASMAEITSFEKFKALCDDMQKHKDELNIDGAFSALPFSGTEGSEWQQEVANAAVFREANDTDNAFDDLRAFLRNNFDFKYSDNARDFLDLTVADGDADKDALRERTMADARRAFAQGKTVFLPGSTELASALLREEGSVLKAERLQMLPLYLGIDGEENYGLSVRTERALAVNGNADADSRQAAVDFLEWLFSTTEGKRYVSEKLGLRAPMNTFTDDERVNDALQRRVLANLGKNDVESVPELLDRLLPTEGMENVSTYLLSYVRGERGWDDLMRDVRTRWNQMLENGKDLLDTSNNSNETGSMSTTDSVATSAG